MMIPTVSRCRGLFVLAGISALALFLSGCPTTSEKASAPKEPPHHDTPAVSTNTPEKLPSKPKNDQLPVAPKTADAQPDAKPDSLAQDLAEEIDQAAEKHRDLGQPLVDEPEKLRRLDPKQPVWLDAEKKQVILLGEVCKAGYPLEFFATYANRSYEAAVAVNVTPSIVHAALLATGAEPGHPAKFDPEFVAPTGTEIAIDVRWKDDQGKVQTSPAQNWIRNIKTKKALDTNWVFAGSLMVTDETTGKQYYQADSGELICVLSLSTAMLDLPILSYGAIEARMFEAFEEHLPPPGTPVTILLKPILTKKG